jgi:hypothetical protein
MDEDVAYVEVEYSDGTIARWVVTDDQADKVYEILGQPDTIQT